MDADYHPKRESGPQFDLDLLIAITYDCCKFLDCHHIVALLSLSLLSDHSFFSAGIHFETSSFSHSYQSYLLISAIFELICRILEALVLFFKPLIDS